MPEAWIFASILALFALLEGVFVWWVVRFVRSTKRNRDAEFSLLDKERQALLELQKVLRSDTESAREATKNGLSKLQKIGLEVHAEWGDMTARFEDVTSEIELRCKDFIDDAMRTLSKKGHECLKAADLANDALVELREATRAAEKVARFFDSQLKLEDVLRELQQQKYQEARQMLVDGVEANRIAKKLGLSMSEVSLVAHTLST